MPTFEKELMSRIRSAIQERSLTQTEAARRTGLSQAGISRIMNGRWRGYRIDHLLQAARHFGYDVEIVLSQAHTNKGRLWLRLETAEP